MRDNLLSPATPYTRESYESGTWIPNDRCSIHMTKVTAARARWVRDRSYEATDFERSTADEVLRIWHHGGRFEDWQQEVIDTPSR